MYTPKILTFCLLCVVLPGAFCSTLLGFVYQSGIFYGEVYGFTINADDGSTTAENFIVYTQSCILLPKCFSMSAQITGGETYLVMTGLYGTNETGYYHVDSSLTPTELPKLNSDFQGAVANDEMKLVIFQKQVENPPPLHCVVTLCKWVPETGSTTQIATVNTDCTVGFASPYYDPKSNKVFSMDTFYPLEAFNVWDINKGTISQHSYPSFKYYAKNFAYSQTLQTGFVLGTNGTVYKVNSDTGDLSIFSVPPTTWTSVDASFVIDNTAKQLYYVVTTDDPAVYLVSVDLTSGQMQANELDDEYVLAISVH